MPRPTEYVAITIAAGELAGAKATKSVIAIKSPAIEHQLHLTPKATVLAIA